MLGQLCGVAGAIPAFAAGVRCSVSGRKTFILEDALLGLDAAHQKPQQDCFQQEFPRFDDIILLAVPVLSVLQASLFPLRSGREWWRHPRARICRIPLLALHSP